MWMKYSHKVLTMLYSVIEEKNYQQYKKVFAIKMKTVSFSYMNKNVNATSVHNSENATLWCYHTTCRKEFYTPELTESSQALSNGEFDQTNVKMTYFHGTHSHFLPLLET